ncbi:hypothetical protein [uncultured Duncaniella sp.]|nr:hypothetical protein [uncultured Duncaniella sp.]
MSSEELTAAINSRMMGVVRPTTIREILRILDTQLVVLNPSER